RAPRHRSSKPKWMRTNDGETSRQSCAFTVNTVRIEKRFGVFGSMVAFGFLLLDFQIGCRNAKATVRIIIPDSFKQSLTSAQRNWNEAMKDKRVANRERRDQQDRSTNYRERIAPYRSATILAAGREYPARAFPCSK